MADARYVIDLILNAHDNTSQALSEFASKLEKVKTNQKALDEQQERSQRATDNYTQSVNKQQKELDDARASIVQMTQANKRNEDSYEKVIKRTVELETATKALTRANHDHETSLAKRAALNLEVEKAQKSLEEFATKGAAAEVRRAAASLEALKQRQLVLRAIAVEEQKIEAQRERDAKQRAAEEAKAERERQQRARETARVVGQVERELNAELEKSRKETQRRLATADAKDDADRAARRRKEEQDEKAAAERRAEIHRADANAGRERQRQAKEEAKEREAAIGRIETASRRLARIDLGSDEAKNLTRELGKAREEFIRLGGSSRDAQRITRDSINAQRTDLAAVIKDVEKYNNAIKRAGESRAKLQKGGLTGAEKIQIEIDGAKAEAQARALAVSIENTLRHIEVNVDLDSGAFAGQAELVEAIKVLLSRPVHVPVDADIDAASFAAATAASRGLGSTADDNKSKFASFFSHFDGHLSQSSNSIAAFDNVIRGLFTFTIAAFLQQLLTIGIAAAGALAALASSAISAGTALGGALAAGAAQAIPVIGLLATAMSRFSAVTDALKQQNLVQQQTAAGASKSANQQKNALDGITSASNTLKGAQDGLQAAQQRVIESQRNLSQARDEARRKLQDLILQEKEAALAAKGAALSQEEAQAALRRAIAQGSGVERAQLNVQEAGLGITSANRRLSRTREDIQERRTEGAPEIRQAQQQLDQARRSAEQASRSVAQANAGLEKAKRSSAEADAGITAATGKLEFLKKQLSGSERDLLEALTTLQNRFREFAKDVTEPLTNAFTRAVRRISGLLVNDEIVGAARNLSSKMAGLFSRIFDSFTNSRTIDQFLRIMKQAGDNLRPLGGIITNLGHAFLNVGEIAGPALHEILEFIKDIAKRFNDFTQSNEGGKRLKSMFDLGVDSLKEWVRLIGAFGRLFLAITNEGGGAKNGNAILDDMTDSLNGLSEKIEDTSSKTSKFFRGFFAESRRILNLLKPIFTALKDEFVKTFGGKEAEDSVKGFVSIVSKVLIPAFGEFLRDMAKIIAVTGRFIEENEKLAKLLGTGLGFFLVAGIISKFGTILEIPLGLFRKLGIELFKGKVGADSFVEAVGKLAGSSRGLALLGNSLKFAGIAGIIAGLVIQFGLLDDILRTIKQAFSDIADRVKGPLKELTKSFQDFSDALNSRSGAMSVLRPFVTFLVGVFLKNVILAARVIGDQLGAIITILSGFVDVSTALLRGDRAALGKAFAKIGRGMLDGFLAPFKELSHMFLKPFKDAVNAVLDFFGIHSDSTMFIRIGRNIVGGFIRGLAGLPRAFLGAIDDAFGGVGSKILNALSSAVAPITGPLESLGKKIAGPLVKGFNSVIGAVKGVVGSFLGGGGKDKPDKPDFGGGSFAGPESANAKIDREDEKHLANTKARQKMLKNVTDDMVDNYRRARKSTGDVMKAISLVTQTSMQEIKINLGTKSKEGKEALTRQFGIAITNIRKAMRAGVVATDDGLEEISRLMRKNLRRYGVSEDQVKSYGRQSGKGSGNEFSKDPDSQVGLAGGGWVGSRGQAGADTVPAMLGMGEAVLNRHQQAVIEGILGHGFLDELFRKVDRPHYLARGGRVGFAKGGRGIVPVPGFPGEEAAASVVPQISAVAKRFGLTLTDAYDRDRSAGHKSPGHNVTGTAADFAGPDRAMDAAVKYLVAKGYLVGYDGRFGSQRWGGHGPSTVAGSNAHLHVEFGKKGGKISNQVYDAIEKIKTPNIGGPGALGKIVRQAMKIATRAANARQEQIAADAVGIPFPGGKGHPGKGAATRGQMVRWATAALNATGVGASTANINSILTLARKESSWVVDALNTWDINAQQGNPSGGLMQVTIDKVGGSKARLFDPIQNMIASIRYQLGRYGRLITFSPYAKGGRVGGAGGGGRWGGFNFGGGGRGGGGGGFSFGGGSFGDGFRRFASGGRVGFAPGGRVLADMPPWVENILREIPKAIEYGFTKVVSSGRNFTSGRRPDDAETPLQRQRLQARAGLYFLPDNSPISLDGITQQLSIAHKALRNIRRVARPEKLDFFIKNIRAITDEGGLLEQFSAQIELYSRRAANRLSLAQVGLRRVGNRIVGRPGGQLTDPVQIAQQEIRNNSRQFSRLQDFREEAANDLDATNASIESVRKTLNRGGLSDKRRTNLKAKLQQLIGIRNRTIEAIDKSDEDIIANRQQQWENAQNLVNAQMAKDLQGVTSGQGFLGAIRRVASATGNTGLSETANNAAIELAKKNQFILTAHFNNVSALAARDPRWQPLADELQDKVFSAGADLVEAVQQKVADASAAADAALARANFNVDIQDRLASLAGRTSGTQAGLFGQIAASNSRKGVLQFEEAGLPGRIAQAFASGNVGATVALQQRLKEVQVAIQEQTQTTRELTDQLRANQVQSLLDRSNAQVGIFGQANDILQKIADGLGDAQSAAQQRINANSFGAQLQIAKGDIAKAVQLGMQNLGGGKQILGQLLSAFQSGPQQFAAALQKNAQGIAVTSDLLNDTDKQVFDNLIQQMISNTGALLDNANSLKDLNKALDPNIQSWSSSAWQWFRSAIFNGIGDVLPQYQVPHMQTGGFVTKSGLFGLHQGEFVVNPSGSNVSHLNRGGDISVTVNEAGGPLDTQALVSRLAFEAKTRGL